MSCSYCGKSYADGGDCTCFGSIEAQEAYAEAWYGTQPYEEVEDWEGEQNTLSEIPAEDIPF